jgi:hypothetical protein
LRATTAARVFSDGALTGRVVFFSRDAFFARSGFAAVLRAPDFAFDGEDFGFVARSFVRDATGAAAGFRAGLAVRITPILMSESSLEAEPMPLDYWWKNMSQTTPRMSTARPMLMARSINMDGPDPACRASVWVSTI